MFAFNVQMTCSHTNVYDPFHGSLPCVDKQQSSPSHCTRVTGETIPFKTWKDHPRTWNVIFSFQYILQSVRGHSASVLTVTINGMQEIRPIIYLLFLSSVRIYWCLGLHRWCFCITHSDAPQSVWLLWTSDQFVTETSTWQHTTLTTDRHPHHRWDSNPRSQQASGRRPTP
jgi:hypothetical protein